MEIIFFSWLKLETLFILALKKLTQRISLEKTQSLTWKYLVWKRVNAHPIRRSNSCLASTLLASFSFGSPRFWKAALMSLSVNAEKCARNMFYRTTEKLYCLLNSAWHYTMLKEWEWRESWYHCKFLEKFKIQMGLIRIQLNWSMLASTL